MGPDSGQRLRAAGLRATAARIAVLDVLQQDGHPSVEEVGVAVRERLGSVSTQAIYDVLRALVDAGLAKHVEPAGSPARFEGRAGDNHHHVVCRGCGAMADVDCAVGEAPCLEPSASAGFVIDEAEVIYWGWCPDCRPATVPGPA